MPGLAKVMAEPKASPHRRLTPPSAPMLMVMTGVSGCRSVISAVAASSSSTSVRLRGITASLGRSAPACCMAVIRRTSSSLGGVFSKSWLEQTTAIPAAWACAMRAGSAFRLGKNSMSSRSAQPEAQTVVQNAAYSSWANGFLPPSAWVRNVTSNSFSPRAARSSCRQCARAFTSETASNQSARHSTQSAFNVENAAAFSKIADSVRSTMGMMTLGRPVPMQQPRNVRFGILIYLHAHDKWNMRPLSSLTRQKAECGFFLVKIALVEIGKIQYNGRRKRQCGPMGAALPFAFVSNRGKYE